MVEPTPLGENLFTAPRVESSGDIPARAVTIRHESPLLSALLLLGTVTLVTVIFALIEPGHCKLDMEEQDLAKVVDADADDAKFDEYLKAWDGTRCRVSSVTQEAADDDFVHTIHSTLTDGEEGGGCPAGFRSAA